MTEVHVTLGELHPIPLNGLRTGNNHVGCIRLDGFCSNYKSLLQGIFYGRSIAFVISSFHLSFTPRFIILHSFGPTLQMCEVEARKLLQT